MIIRMKRLSYFSLLLCVLSLSLYAGNETFLNKKEKAYIEEKATLNVYVEPDVYFYTYTYDNYLNGYAIHYLRLLARKLDVNLNFVTGITREEAKQKLSSGALDMALFPIFGTSDENAFQLSRFPLGILQPALLMPKIYQISPKLESIENLRIVMLKGDAFGEIIKEKNPDAHIEVVDTLDQVVSKVAQQEVDLAIGLHELFQTHLESKRVTSLQSIPLHNNADFPTLKLSLAMAKDNITLLSIINKTMSAIDYKELVFARQRFFSTNAFRQTNITAPLSEEEKFFLMGKQVLSMCVIPHSLPYGDIVDNRYEGMGADFITYLEKSLDTPIQLVPTHSREESLQKLLNKKCDFISFDTQTVHSDEKISFTSPLLRVPLVVITTNDRLYVSDFKEIQDHSFVLLKDHPMQAVLHDAFPSLKLAFVDSEIEGLKLVEEGKYYGLITSNFTVSHLFQKYIATHLKVSAQVPLQMPFSFAVLNENELLYSILESASVGTLRQTIDPLVK